jgi:hypothetical protein
VGSQGGAGAWQVRAAIVSPRNGEKASSMPRRCTVCDHPERHSIDEALVSGVPYRSVARRFELSESSVYRHKTEHLPAHLLKAREVEVEHFRLKAWAFRWSPACLNHRDCQRLGVSSPTPRPNPLPQNSLKARIEKHCPVCEHPEKTVADRALGVDQTSPRSIKRRYCDLSRKALARQRDVCLACARAEDAA